MINQIPVNKVIAFEDGQLTEKSMDMLQTR
jgi:hypothetical protein